MYPSAPKGLAAPDKVGVHRRGGEPPVLNKRHQRRPLRIRLQLRGHSANGSDRTQQPSRGLGVTEDHRWQTGGRGMRRGRDAMVARRAGDHTARAEESRHLGCDRVIAVLVRAGETECLVLEVHATTEPWRRIEWRRRSREGSGRRREGSEVLASFRDGLGKSEIRPGCRLVDQRQWRGDATDRAPAEQRRVPGLLAHKPSRRRALVRSRNQGDAPTRYPVHQSSCHCPRFPMATKVSLGSAPRAAFCRALAQPPTLTAGASTSTPSSARKRRYATATASGPLR